MSSEEAKEQVEALLGAIETRGVEVLEAMVAMGIPRPVALAAVSGRMLRCAFDTLFLSGKSNSQIRTLLKAALPAARAQFGAAAEKVEDKPRIIVPDAVRVERH